MFRRRREGWEIIVMLGIIIMFTTFQFEYDQPFAVFVAGAMTLVFGIALKLNKR